MSCIVRSLIKERFVQHRREDIEMKTETDGEMFTTEQRDSAAAAENDDAEERTRTDIQ